MEDLNLANEKFKQLFDRVRKNPKFRDIDEKTAYLFFLYGWKEGSGMTQMTN